MRFLDILFGRYRKNGEKDEPIFVPEDGQVAIEGKSPDIVGELSVDGNFYLIRDFEMDFMQDTDKDNHPYGIPYGGFIKLVFIDKPALFMKEWIISPQKRYNGEIRFYKNTSQNVENALITILFNKACCVNYEEIYNAPQKMTLVKLCICPRQIKIGNEEFE